MKLFGFTYVYNVEEMIPYVMPYVERMGYDQFVIYDDGSTDNTVQLLSKYSFVEIRKANRGSENFDKHKAGKILDFLLEKTDESIETNEIIWVTCTDFDEVLFFNKEISVKGYLEAYYTTHGMNYFAKEMINILPRKGETKIEADGHELIHTIEGVRGNYAGMDYFKPTMLCVNDCTFFYVVDGNHTMKVNTLNDKPLINIADEGAFYAFHLKYVNKEVIEKAYADRAIRGCYQENLKQLNDIYYNRKLGTSFLLENYFLFDGLWHKINEWNGLTKI